jgi:hypothetical protein
MNLLHYEAKFPANSTRMVKVSYRQYAFADTRGTGSYQLAYVLHPATLWQDFGPIQLALSVPEGVDCRASAAVQPTETKEVKPGGADGAGDGEKAVPRLYPTLEATYRAKIYRATLDKPEQKKGELFVAVDKAAWDKAFPAPKPKPAQQQRNQSAKR